MGAHDLTSSKNEESFTGNSETEDKDKNNEYERGEHPNSRANLQPFPKGVSGNPNGRPFKYEKLKLVLNEYGDGETKDWHGNSKGTRREQVWERIWKEAIMGDMKYVQLLARLECLDKK